MSKAHLELHRAKRVVQTHAMSSELLISSCTCGRSPRGADTRDDADRKETP
jgi:hypothetical protein